MAFREIPVVVVGLAGMIVGVLHDFFAWLDGKLERWFEEMSGK